MYAIKWASLALVIGLSMSVVACNTSTPDASADTHSGSAQHGKIAHISNAELQDLLDKGVTLVDIRLPEEWKETGTIAQSHRLTLFEKNGAVATNFLANLQKIVPADKPVALICRSGNRTRAGADMLAQVGYSQVYNVKRGMNSWLKEGRPVARQ